MSRNNQSKSLAMMFLLGAFLTGGVLGFAADRVIVSKKEVKQEVTHEMTVKEGRDQFARELNLDDVQRVMLDSVLDWRNARERELFKPLRPMRNAIRDSARTLIYQQLDSAQKAKFNQMEQMRGQGDSTKQQQQR